MNHECCRSNCNGYCSKVWRGLIWDLDIFWKCNQYVSGGNFQFWNLEWFGWYLTYFLSKVTNKNLHFADFIMSLKHLNNSSSLMKIWFLAYFMHWMFQHKVNRIDQTHLITFTMTTHGFKWLFIWIKEDISCFMQISPFHPQKT